MKVLIKSSYEEFLALKQGLSGISKMAKNKKNVIFLKNSKKAEN